MTAGNELDIRKEIFGGAELFYQSHWSSYDWIMQSTIAKRAKNKDSKDISELKLRGLDVVSCYKEQERKGIKDDSQVSNLGSDSDAFLARRSGFRFLFLFSFLFWEWERKFMSLVSRSLS